MTKPTGTRIITDHTEIKVISQICRCSPLTTRKALRGDKSVQKYGMIRKVAVERGAVEMVERNSGNE